MVKYRCYWCMTYVAEEAVIRRDGLGFCCTGCIISFVNNGCQPKTRKKA